MKTRIFFTDCLICKKRVKITQTEEDPHGKCPECGSRRLREIPIAHSSETPEGYRSKRQQEIMKMKTHDHRE